MATILDLKPSISVMPYESVLDLVMQIRLSRRQSKHPAKQRAKAETKTGNGLAKNINNMNSDTAAALLKALEALLK